MFRATVTRLEKRGSVRIGFKKNHDLSHAPHRDTIRQDCIPVRANGAEPAKRRPGTAQAAETRSRKVSIERRSFCVSALAASAECSTWSAD